MATFYLVSQWLAIIRTICRWHVIHHVDQITSIYTVGSLLCVFITAPPFSNTVRPTTLLMLYTFILIYRPAHRLLCIPTFYVVIIFAFVIGFTSAGGVVQIGLTLMAERFSTLKEKQRGSITVAALQHLPFR